MPPSNTLYQKPLSKCMKLIVCKYYAISFRVPVALISLGTTFFYILIKNGVDFAIFIQSISIFGVTGAGFVLNDIYDYKKDKNSDKIRPICQDLLPKKIALLFSILILLISASIPAFFRNWDATIIIAITIIGISIYSPLSKHFSFFKGLFTAALCCMPLLYGSALINYNLNPIILLPIILFIIGREIILDIFDMKGDAHEKRATIPNILGKSVSKNLAWVFMNISGVLLILLSLNNLSSTIISLVIISLLLYSTFIPIKQESRIVFLTRLIMILSIFTISFL